MPPRRSAVRVRNPPVHYFPSLVHLRWQDLVVWLVRVAFLLNISQTAGVTHWKLIDNSIIPEPSLDSQGKEATSKHSNNIYPMSQLSSSDPEFAMLVRYSARGSSGGGGITGSANRGSGGFGTFRRQDQGGSHLNSCSSSSVSGEGVAMEEGEGPARCHGSGAGVGGQRKSEGGVVKQPRNPDGSGPMSESDMAGAQPSPLTCGDPVEYTVYDFLKGIARRNEHKSFPEPEVAMIFKKSETDNTVDLFDVEMGLRKAYLENPMSLTVLNQVGNFWRIKGNTQHAIECFRKALHISSDHPDLLLNLARVLFNLKFYDDAVFLAKRSLHMKASDSHAWLQYFTLGEVYKALEKYEEAAFYFKKSLQKNPGLQVAEMHLKELGLDQQHSVNVYTMLIIFGLVSVVLALIYYLICAMSR